MPSSLTIRVHLPADRTKTGELSLIDPFTNLPVFGPVPVLGKAAQDAANAHNNPSRNSTLLYGDTPLGGYAVTHIVSNGPGTSRPILQYGKSGSIVLDPKSGNAATAKVNGRTGLLIHAGRQNSPTPLPSHLKPTNGCLRMLDGDLARLIDSIKQNGFLFPGTVTVEIATTPGSPANLDESIQDGDPPPMTGSDILP